MNLTATQQFVWCPFPLSDRPYIRLYPRPLPGKNGTNVEVNVGADLELRVRIEAYPEIKVTWDTPRSHNHSMEFDQHNNR